MVRDDPRVRDAGWFPVDYDARQDVFHMLAVEHSRVMDAAFLDSRFNVDWQGVARIRTSDIAAVQPIPQTAAWLWHTSFCGSTLLARMLDIPPCSLALREPLVLRRLSDAANAGMDVDRPLRVAIALLSRRWPQGGKVLIKPTHAALNIGSRTIQKVTDGRSILLTSGLEDFLISNLKKPEETQAKAALLAERALNASDLPLRLPVAALTPPNVLCAAALQWAAQRELALTMQRASAGALRQADSCHLFADPLGFAQQCAEWLGLPLSHAQLTTRNAEVSRWHAKAMQRPYSAAIRVAEKAAVARSFSAVLGSTLDWAERLIFPAMRPEALSTNSPP